VSEVDTKFTRNNPMRSPDWRWQRAWNLRDRQKLPRSEDNDQYVLDAIRYMNQEQAQRQPELCWAENLARREEYLFIKAELEARLLAGQSDEEIAGRLAASPKTVEYYEAWFYHVRDRLDAPGYLWHRLVLPLMEGEPSREVIWKLFAFLYGEKGLDELIYDGRTDKPPVWADDMLNTMTRRLAVWCHFASPEDVAEKLGRLVSKLSSGKQSSKDVLPSTLIQPLENINWRWGDMFPTIGGVFLFPHERPEPPQQVRQLIETAKYERKN